MRSMRIWSMAIVGWCVLAVLAQAEPEADPREKLETVIPEAIRLLEAKEYIKFFQTCVAPEDIKKVTERGSLEDLAKNFGERNAARLLAVLQSVKDVEPIFAPEGNLAVYKLKEPVSNRSTIVWKKIDKYWYLQN